MSSKLVIFDLDNTLIITSTAAKDAYKQAIRFLADQHGIGRKSNKLYHHWKRLVQSLKNDPDPIKRQFDYSLKLLMQKHQIPQNYLNLALTQFNREFLSNLKLQRGAKEIIQILKDKRIKIAIATESMRSLAKQKIKSVGLNNEIDLLVTANDVGSMKPNPAYYQMAIDQLKASPANVLVVGDEKNLDIKPAQQLNLKTILIPPNNFHLLTIKDEVFEFFKLT